MLAVTDAGQLQPARRLERTGAENELARRIEAPNVAIDHGLDADGPPAFEQHADDPRVGEHRQVGAGSHGRQEGDGGALPHPVPDRVAQVRNAFVIEAIEVVAALEAQARTGGDRGLGQLAALAMGRHLERPAGTAQLVGAECVVLDRLEALRDLGPAPADSALRGPLVVVLRMAAHVDHAVDRARAAQHLPARPDLLSPPFACVGRHRGVVGMLRVREQLAEALGHGDQGAAVLGAGFDQQHPMGGVLAEAVGEHAAGRAGADDEIGGVGHRSAQVPDGAGIGFILSYSVLIMESTREAVKLASDPGFSGCEAKISEYHS